MSDTDDARRARGWREQYMAVNGPSALLDAPSVIACGRNEWEPVPGAPVNPWEYVVTSLGSVLGVESTADAVSAALRRLCGVSDAK